MQDLLFGVFLFCILFSTSCCAIASDKATSSAKQHAPELNSQENAFAGSTHRFDVEVKAMLDEVYADGTASLEKEIAPVRVLPVVDIDLLKLRDARQLCKQLGIRQKVGGKDAPLSWMKAQISAKLAEKLEKIVVCVEEPLAV